MADCTLSMTDGESEEGCSLLISVLCPPGALTSPPHDTPPEGRPSSGRPRRGGTCNGSVAVCIPRRCGCLLEESARVGWAAPGVGPDGTSAQTEQSSATPGGGPGRVAARTRAPW